MRYLINIIVKFWYTLPKYKIEIKRKNVDSRSFEWYLSRQKCGFDERVLWHLSLTNDKRIRRTLGLPESNDNVPLKEFSEWFNSIQSTEDIKWFSDRVNKYIEWSCPYSYYGGRYVGYLEQKEIDKILERYKNILLAKIQNMKISSEEVEFLYKYNRFGW